MRSNLVRLALVALVAATAAFSLPPAAPGAEDDSGTYRYTFHFESLTDRLDPRQDWTADRATTAIDLMLRSTGVTAVAFFLNWTDDEGANDTLRLSVREPGGPSHGPVGGAAARGSVVLRVVDGDPAPGPVTIDAASEEEAYRKLAALHPPPRWATGTWNATVRVETKGSLVGGIIPVQDAGNGWELTTVFRYRQAIIVDVQPVAPDAPPANDTVPNGTAGDHPFNPGDGTILTEVRYPTFWETPAAEIGILLASAGVGVAAALLVASRLGRPSPSRR